MKRYGVRPSVCLSQHGPAAANLLLLWAWQSDIDRLLQHAHTHTHDRLTAFGPELPGWAGTRRNTHQHTHPDHRTSFINFLHLQRSIASSLFSLRAWQSSLTTSVRVLFGLPLGLGPDIDIALVFFSFQLSPPYGNLPLLHSPCISVAAAAAGSATLSAYIDSWTQTSLLTYCRFGRGRRNAVCSSFCLLSSPF